MRDLKPCRDCERTLVPRMVWDRADRTTRDDWLALGWGQHKSRGLCQACWRIAQREGRLEEYDSLVTRAAVVLEEWRFIEPELPNGTQQDKLRYASQRLGMTPDAIRLALKRARAEEEA